MVVVLGASSIVNYFFPCSKNDTGVRLRISMPCARNCEPTASCVVISTIVHCHQSMAISRLVKDQLIADSSDFFNRKLKYPLYVFVTGYVVIFLINRTVFNFFEGFPAVANSTEDGQVHVAADSGLLMNLRNFRNREFYTYQRLHSSFAVGAFVMVLFQKFTVMGFPGRVILILGPENNQQNAQMLVFFD